MRIAIVTDAWHPQISGVVTTLTQMEKGLTERGHEVGVFNPEQFLHIPCPTYRDIPLAILPKRKLSRLLDDFAPEAVHIATEGPVGMAGRKYCLERELPFTSSFTTKFPEYIELRTGIPADFFYRRMRDFHASAVRTTVATEALYEELAEKGFEHLVYWGRGVDAELFRPREKDVLDAPRPISIYMGRVAVEKNIEAFLKLDLPGTKVVVGPGPAVRKLSKAYPEARFLGLKQGEDLARHVAAGDVFVFPSLTDTFGLVMLEAMACGLPVAACPVVGPKDVVVHGETGWLSEDLGEAVSKALEMSPDACRARALEFPWSTSLDQFERNLEPVAVAETAPAAS